MERNTADMVENEALTLRKDNTKAFIEKSRKESFPMEHNEFFLQWNKLETKATCYLPI